jgi:hypothetical protein
VATDGNLYADLLKIADGEVSVASDRLRRFNEYANTIPSSPARHEDGATSPDQATDAETTNQLKAG